MKQTHRVIPGFRNLMRSLIKSGRALRFLNTRAPELLLIQIPLWVSDIKPAPAEAGGQKLFLFWPWFPTFVGTSSKFRDDAVGGKLRDPTLILAALFSLGLHGLIASFLIPSAPKTTEGRMTTVEVIWERMDTPSQEQPQRSEKPKKPLPIKENRVVSFYKRLLPRSKRFIINPPFHRIYIITEIRLEKKTLPNR